MRRLFAVLAAVVAFLDISPIGGARVRALIAQIANTPPDQLRRIENLITASGG